MERIEGAFVACSLDPQGIIAMDFSSLKQAQDKVAALVPKINHWVLSGILKNDLQTLYEEKDGIILINKFVELECQKVG
jgi:hypothetical protein